MERTSPARRSGPSSRTPSVRGFSAGGPTPDQVARIKASLPDDQPEQSPWSHVDLDAEHPVGWRDGSALTRTDVKAQIAQNKTALHQYRGLRTTMSKKTTQEVQDPLKGLPATWNSFWSTVPHLDAQVAWKKHQDDKKAAEKAAAKAARSDVGMPIVDKSAAEEEKVRLHLERIKELEKEIGGNKRKISQAQHENDKWGKELKRVRRLDEEEAKEHARLLRMVEKASYRHGILEGQIRSSDVYFDQLYKDCQNTHKRKTVTLKRAVALLNKQLDVLKGDIREMLTLAGDIADSEHSRPTSEVDAEEDYRKESSGSRPSDAASAEGKRASVASDDGGESHDAASPVKPNAAERKTEQDLFGPDSDDEAK